MAISGYKVQVVLNSYLQQLRNREKVDAVEVEVEEAELVPDASDEQKKNKMDQMGKDAVRSLHQWALKPFKEKDDQEN